MQAEADDDDDESVSSSIGSEGGRDGSKSESASDEDKEVCGAVAKEDWLDKIVTGGGSRKDERRLESGKVGSIFEEGLKAAGEGIEVDIKEKYEASKIQVGPGERSESEADVGQSELPEWSNREVAEINCRLGCPPQAQVSQASEESLLFPPGWGPNAQPFDNEYKKEQPSSPGKAQNDGEVEKENTNTSEASLQFPPGWGPNPEFVQATGLIQIPESEKIQPTSSESLGGSRDLRLRPITEAKRMACREEIQGCGEVRDEENSEDEK